MLWLQYKPQNLTKILHKAHIIDWCHTLIRQANYVSSKIITIFLSFTNRSNAFFQKYCNSFFLNTFVFRIPNVEHASIYHRDPVIFSMNFRKNNCTTVTVCGKGKIYIFWYYYQNVASINLKIINFLNPTKSFFCGRSVLDDSSIG